MRRFLSVLTLSAILLVLPLPGTAQDRSACEVEVVLLPTPLDGSTDEMGRVRVWAFVVDSCDLETLYFIATFGNGITNTILSQLVILDDLPA